MKQPVEGSVYFYNQGMLQTISGKCYGKTNNQFVFYMNYLPEDLDQLSGAPIFDEISKITGIGIYGRCKSKNNNNLFYCYIC